MPYDPQQLEADANYLTSLPQWQDEKQRPQFIRDVASKARMEADTETHRALVDELWNRSKGGALAQGADFVTRSAGEVLKSIPAAPAAGLLAASDAAGATDSGSDTRLKRGVLDMVDTAVQRFKQNPISTLLPMTGVAGMAMDALLPDQQQQRDQTLDSLKQDIDAGAYPKGLGRWLAGDDNTDAETKPWVDALTRGIATRAVAADHSTAVNSKGKVDSQKVNDWLKTDRNPAFLDSDTPGVPGPRALLADYLVTRDPSSWDAFKARVSETDSQYKTRLQRFAAEAPEFNRVVAAAPKGSLSQEMMTRTADMQTSPLDLSSAVLPVLRSIKILKAATVGAKGQSLLRRGVTDAAQEFGQEAGTEMLSNPNASTSQILEAGAMGAVGQAAISTPSAIAGTVANRFSPQDPNAPLPPTQTATPSATAPNASPAAQMGAGASQVPSTLSRIAAESVAPEEDTGALTAQDLPQGMGQTMSDPLQQQASVTKDSGVTADQTAQNTPGAGLSPAAGAFLPTPQVRSPEAQAYAQALEEARLAEAARLRMIDNKAQGMPVIPDSPTGSRDILDFANENPIYLPPGFSEQRNLPEYENLKEAKLPQYWRQFIASGKRGGNPSTVAQRAFDAGLIPEPTADAYFTALREGIDGRKQYRAQFATREKALAAEEKQVVDFEKTQDKLAKKTDTQEVPFEDVLPGDKLTIDGENAVVRKVEHNEDGYLTNVVIEDGKRFGLMQFDPQNRSGILVDEYQPQAARNQIAASDFAPADTAPASLDSLLQGTESTRPRNVGETARAQNADPLGELMGARLAGEAEQAQGKMAPLLLPKNFTGNAQAGLAAAAGTMRQGDNQTIRQGDRQPVSLSPSPIVSLSSAYSLAARGSSTQMLPIRAVYEQAKAQNPALTPAQFMQEVQAGDAAGTVLLDVPENPATLQAAGPFVLRNALGVPSTGMMVQDLQALQNPANDKMNEWANRIYPLRRAIAAEIQQVPLPVSREAGVSDFLVQLRDYFADRASNGHLQDWHLNPLIQQPIYRADYARNVDEYYRASKELIESVRQVTQGRLENITAGLYGNANTLSNQPGSSSRTQTGQSSQAGESALQSQESLASRAELKAAQVANESKLSALGLPTKPGTRIWARGAVATALKKIAADGSYPATMRAMADLLAKVDLNNLLLKIEGDARLSYAGKYQPLNAGRGEISLNTRVTGRGETDIVQSLVHELLHHATYRALRSPKNATQRGAIADLEALRKRALAALSAQEQGRQFDYELSNTDEFIAALFTRADFQTALAAIPAELAPKSLSQRVRSVLDEIFRVLGELVTGKTVQPGSVLEASFSATLRLMEQTATAGGMTNAEGRMANDGALLNPAEGPQMRENRSRMALSEEEQRMYEAQTNAGMLAQAEQWLAGVDNETAVRQLETGLPPDGLRFDHLPALTERTLQRLVQTTTSKNEIERLKAEALLDRAFTAHQDIINRQAGTALQQVGAANDRLAAIMPIMGAKKVLIDRAKAVGKARFDGGWEGLVMKINDLLKRIEALTAGTTAQNIATGESTPGLKAMLNALRKKMYPGMDWTEIFTDLPSTQKARQLAIYDRLMKDERLQGLTQDERIALTNELDKAWMRERRTVFNRELTKAGILGEKNASDRQKVKNALPRLLRLMNLGMFNSEMFREVIAKEYGLKVIDAKAAAELRAIGEEIQKAPEGLPRRKKEQQLMDRLQSLAGSTFWQVLDSWWTASVLSGWRTQVDIGAGIANGIEDVGLGSIVTALRTGNKDVALRGLGNLFGRIPSAFMEAVDHVTTGNKAMMRNFELEVKQAMEGGNRMASDVGAQMWRDGGWRKVPGAFMIFYGRLLTALDHINSASTREGAKAMAMARHPELYQKALRISAADKQAARQQARLELTGGAMPATQQERLEETARMREILEQSIPAEALAEATEIGRAAALQGEPTGLGGGLLDMVNAAVGIVARKAEAMGKRPGLDAKSQQMLKVLQGTAPLAKAITGTKFARTLAHSLNRTLSYVPGVGAYAVGQQGRSGAFGDILAAKQVIGTLVGIALYLAFDDDDDEKGIEDGWKDKTPQEKAQLYAQGKQPFTVWERDEKGRVRSFNYQQWGIAGIVNTVAAMLKQKGSEAGVVNVLMSSLVQGGMSFTDKAQLQGLQTIFGEGSRSTDPVKGIAGNLNKWAAQTVGGLVPRLAKDIDMVASPELRDSSFWWQHWTKEVPMLRQLTSGKRIDILGGDVLLDRGPLSRVTQLGTADPAYRMLGRLNAKDIWLPDPSQGQRVVKLNDGTRRDMTPAEKDRYQRLTGQLYRKYIEEEGALLLQMKPADAQDRISTVTKNLRNRAAYQATH